MTQDRYRPTGADFVFYFVPPGEVFQNDPKWIAPEDAWIQLQVFDDGGTMMVGMHQHLKPLKDAMRERFYAQD